MDQRIATNSLASSDRNPMNGRILVFNCHEAWVYQLRLLNRPLDIIVGLPGRHTGRWDQKMRPLPAQAQALTLKQVLASQEHYDCIVAHNLTDLLDASTLVGAKLMVIHLTLDGMLLEQDAKTDPSAFRAAVADYVNRTSVHVMAVSKLKGQSWGFTDDIVPLAADPGDYATFDGGQPRGLRVSNFIARRARTLLWDFHEQVFAGLPITLVGHNPELPGVKPAADWDSLKEMYRSHRFFIHTANPQLEDGYNMATLEAMAAGLPVLGNCHPTSPVINGVNGFLSDDPEMLKRHAIRLLENPFLAVEMGRAAQQTIRDQFSNAMFCRGMSRSIGTAREKWNLAHRSVAV
jgi:glycosyltransferase involved in cell wall biosynthesis